MPTDDENDLTVLDSQDAKDSASIAEARHLVRRHMLLENLNALNEIGMNPEQKTADRVVALRFLVEFAASAEGTGEKWAQKMSPKAALLIAKIGTSKNVTQRKLKPSEADPSSPTAGRKVLPHGAKGERVDHSVPDGDEGEGDGRGNR